LNVRKYSFILPKVDARRRCLVNYPPNLNSISVTLYSEMAALSSLLFLFLEKMVPFLYNYFSQQDY
jgi:hypothetical protein